MNFSAFLNPANLQDTPRLFTAIAEWLAVFVYFNIYKRKYHGRTFVMQCIGALLIQVVFQFIAGILPLSFLDYYNDGGSWADVSFTLPGA